ncbi:transcriptional regulator [Streptomyces halstedii]|uniref:Transcriptional regulator n=2 Tax=Streptomyces halstedii TaxID=1944 RepID=A0A6N9UDG9_STRHA|nr:transcriptional regulator [Streptomyces halstedii]
MGGAMTKSGSAKVERNEVLLKHLETLDWSISGFARRIAARCEAIHLPYTVVTSTVSRWCKGATPSADLAAAACHVLSNALHQVVTPESLGWPSDTGLVAAQSLEYLDVPHAVRMLSKLWALDAMRRRNVVKSAFSPSVFGPASREALVMPADAVIGGHGQHKVSAADIDLLDEQTRLFGKLDSQHGGGKFRSAFASMMDTHATPMLNGSFSARTGCRLYGSAVDAVLAMASMAYDDQLPGLAQRYDLQAMRMAQAIGDRARITRVHIHQARLAATQGGQADVLAHARSAVLAAQGAPPLVRAYACVTEARAWALNGQADQVVAAVKRAREFFIRSQSSAGPAWLEWFDLRELEGQAAWAFAVAGLAEQGIQSLKEASALPSDRTRDTVELLITEAVLARLRGDSAEHMTAARRASQASQHLMSRRLSERLDRLNTGEPLRDF